MSQFYNCIAEKYDYIFPLSPAHKTFFASELHGHTVLDVGAATGNLTDHLLSEGYEVTAIDLSERLIAKAAKKGIVVQPLNMLHIDQLAIFDNIVCIGNTLPHLDSKTSVQLFLQKLMDNSPKGVNLSCNWSILRSILLSNKAITSVISP